MRRREPGDDEKARAVTEALLTEVFEGAALVRELDLAPGADLRLEFELPGGTIAGSVIGADGRPAWALVELWPGPVARAHVRPPEPRFEFVDVAAGPWTLRVGEPGFAALTHSGSGSRVVGRSFDLALGAGESLERTLQLAPASPLVGRVVDEGGSAGEGARTWLWRAETPVDPLLAGISIEDGRFWTPSLVEGRIALVALSDERVSSVLGLEHAVGDASALELELRLGADALLELEGLARAGRAPPTATLRRAILRR